MRKVAIVGANGFIGSNLTRHLALHGYNVKAMVDGRFDYKKLQSLPNVECVEFTLEHIEDMNEDSRFDDIDFLYHTNCILNHSEREHQARLAQDIL